MMKTLFKKMSVFHSPLLRNTIDSGAEKFLFISD